MKKCEKILFNVLDKRTRHVICQSFLEEERKLQMKSKKTAK